MTEPKNIFSFYKQKNDVSRVNIKVPKVNAICNRAVLFANVRNEDHILEWAAHHLLIGFSRIIIFDHKSDKPLKKIFKNFDKRVTIINVSYLENPIKMFLMNKAAEIARNIKMDWMIYLDADEFIILDKKYKGIKHFLSLYNHADSLSINWLMFGSNHLEKEPDGLILENYTKSELFLDSHVKCFVRPSRVRDAINPHYFNMLDNLRIFNIDNKLITTNYHFNPCHVEFNQVPIYIAHYVYQSEETFKKRKVVLPRDDNGKIRDFHEKEDVKFIHNLYNGYENLQPKNRYVENVKKFLDDFIERKNQKYKSLEMN